MKLTKIANNVRINTSYISKEVYFINPEGELIILLHCPFCGKIIELKPTEIFGEVIFPEHMNSKGKIKITEQVINLKKILENHQIKEDSSGIKKALISEEVYLKRKRSAIMTILMKLISFIKKGNATTRITLEINDNRTFEAI